MENMFASNLRLTNKHHDFLKKCFIFIYVTHGILRMESSFWKYIMVVIFIPFCQTGTYLFIFRSLCPKNNHVLYLSGAVHRMLYWHSVLYRCDNCFILKKMWNLVYVCTYGEFIKRKVVNEVLCPKIFLY